MSRTQFGHSKRRRQIAGVTLLELMVVVVVVAVLGAIAIPSYRQYTMRAQRSEAKSALLRLATNQERFYLQNNQFSNDPIVLGFDASKSEYGVYTISLNTKNGWAQDYIATATPTPGGGGNGVDMTNDTECTSFTMTSQGVRFATPLPNGVNGRCW